ncbi:MAG: MOFRL family protein [Sandaracinus sp.]
MIGGETTVTLQARSGRGGRSQELVLGAYLARPHGLVIAFGTDGIDGASDHAGAYLDERAWARASALGLDARGALKRHDSERFFAALGTAIVTGPTGTNAADVACVLPRALRSG